MPVTVQAGPDRCSSWTWRVIASGRQPLLQFSGCMAASCTLPCRTACDNMDVVRNPMDGAKLTDFATSRQPTYSWRQDADPRAYSSGGRFATMYLRISVCGWLR